jgi:hypothetical protein
VHREREWLSACEGEHACMSQAGAINRRGRERHLGENTRERWRLDSASP